MCLKKDNEDDWFNVSLVLAPSKHMIFDDFLLILLSHWVDECLKDNLQTAKLAQWQLKKND